MAGNSTHSFLPAPTAYRHLLRILISLEASWKFQVLTCDISQDFLQSDKLPEKDKYLVIPPACIKLNGLKWDGHIQVDNSQQLGYRERYAFLCHKPIYGSTDAPLRWYTTLARHIRKCGYLPHRTDMCAFSKRENGIVVDLVIVHVDDLIMTGTSSVISALKLRMGKFHHGPITFADEKEPAIYCGLTTVRNPPLGITQDVFVEMRVL